MAEISAAQKQKLQDLRKANPTKEIQLARAGGKDFYIAAPSQDIWHMFKEAAADPKRRKAATENLVARCAVDPDASAVAEIFKKKPALADTLANQVGVLAGIDEEAEILFFDEG